MDLLLLIIVLLVIFSIVGGLALHPLVFLVLVLALVLFLFRVFLFRGGRRW